MARKKKVFSAKDFLNSRKGLPTFEHNGKQYLMCGTNLETNMVNIKNLESGNYKEIDYYSLEQILKNK